MCEGPENKSKAEALRGLKICPPRRKSSGGNLVVEKALVWKSVVLV